MLHHDEHRRDLVGEHVGVSGGGQPLARHAHYVQTLVIKAMLTQIMIMTCLERLVLVLQKVASEGS